MPQQGQQVPYWGYPDPGAQPGGQQNWGQQPAGTGQTGAYGYPAPNAGHGWQYGAAHQQSPVQRQAAGPVDDTGRPLAIIIAVWAIIAGLRTLIDYPIDMVQFWMEYGGYSTVPMTIAWESWNFLSLLDAAALVTVGILLFARRHKARFFATAVIALTVTLYVMDVIFYFIWTPDHIEHLYEYFYSWIQLSGNAFYLIPAVFALLPGTSRTLRTKPKQQQPPRQPTPAGPHPAYPGQPQPLGPTPATPRRSGKSPAPTILGIATIVISGIALAISVTHLVSQITTWHMVKAVTTIWILDGAVLLVLGIMLLTRTHLVKGIAVGGMAVSAIAVCLGVFDFGLGVYDWRTPLNVGYTMETADGIMFYCSILVAMLVFLPSVLHSLRRKPVPQPPQQQYYYGTPTGY
ncbi:hypothetical protein SAMN04487819_10526 [Actinopolyspora alba]|uniref:Uncharacterized protein n=2 Tax=Actinopolyspora alba TaxID=673379 RepID=A0A1I1W6C1_9ACTN|nr:hypothetical protein SAMN04487819_10526 [Actinopolyspora alba]